MPGILFTLSLDVELMGLERGIIKPQDPWDERYIYLHLVDLVETPGCLGYIGDYTLLPS